LSVSPGPSSSLSSDPLSGLGVFSSSLSGGGAGGCALVLALVCTAVCVVVLIVN
jgi:hypothetical protein